MILFSVLAIRVFPAWFLQNSLNRDQIQNCYVPAIRVFTKWFFLQNFLNRDQIQKCYGCQEHCLATDIILSIVIKSKSPLLPNSRYYEPWTTLDRYITRDRNKKFISTTSPGTISVDGYRASVVTIPLLDFVTFS